MARINLDKMNSAQLQELKEAIAAREAQQQENNRRVAKEEIQGILSAHGFTLEELFGKSSARKPSKVAPKYRNPKNAEETWSGRGRRPRWLEAELAKGKSVEDFAI